MQKRDVAARRGRAILALALVAMYIVGLIAMITSNVKLGSILWTISTLGGIGLLYWLHVLRKREQADSGDQPDGSKGA